MIYYSYAETPAGAVLLTSDGVVTTGIYWKLFKRIPQVGEEWVENKPFFSSVIAQLDEYFKGNRKTFDFPYKASGTTFQKQVWKELENLEYGTFSSYQAIAAAVGKPKAVRAVGTAVGSNPLSIVAPCHRVLSLSGKITGYAGGVAAKSLLLRLERITFSA